ncbi:phosphatidylinositol-specific phospholipase C [Enterococcus faecalis]|uniref:phosphatidylinositol-specific phospholipase C n=1 Tax=Enterococcus faecalis TaxID=1351 RepID=UPI0034CD1B4C
MKNLVSRKIFEMALFFVIVFGMFGCAPSTYAQGGADTTAADGIWYNEQYYKTWMKDIPDSTRLSDLSIPGTHETMTAGVSGGLGFAQNQSLGLTTQLNNGIRFIDVRARYIDGVFTIHHGDYYTHSNLGDVFNRILVFLKQNPSETVLMRLKQEKSNLEDNQLNIEFQKYFKRYDNLIWKNNNSTSNPTLGEIRGKVVILRNFNGSLNGNIGLQYPGNMNIQDKYEDMRSGSKKTAVDEQLKASSSGKGNGIIYINYLSFTGNWLTNWTNAQDLNPHTFDYIRDNLKSNVGIVVSDYPGGALIWRIIKCNFG